MDISSLGFRTDVMVLALGESAIEHHDRHLVARTPRNPTYWWGNFVLFADPVGTGEVDDGSFPSLEIGATRAIFEDLWDEAARRDRNMAIKNAEGRLEPAFLRHFRESMEPVAPTSSGP